MQITSLFRFILILGLIISIISVVAGSTLSDTLPPILQDYLLQLQDEEVFNTELKFLLIATPIILILLPISTIGLWYFKSCR